MNKASGRIRYETLVAERPDIDLTLVAPDRWIEYGKRMQLDPHSGPLNLPSKVLYSPANLTRPSGSVLGSAGLL